MNAPAGLNALILAGGRSRRMGADKKWLSAEGDLNLRRLYRILASRVDRVYVSIRADQRGQEPFRSLPTVVDRREGMGPIAGLLSAFDVVPGKAWLLTAVDMPRVDQALVDQLIGSRDCGRLATLSFNRESKKPEPLFSIYEPSLAPHLMNAVERREFSMLGLLATVPIRITMIRDTGKLVNVNTRGEIERLMEVSL